jgi:hypothetical protein
MISLQIYPDATQASHVAMMQQFGLQPGLMTPLPTAWQTITRFYMAIELSDGGVLEVVSNKGFSSYHALRNIMASAIQAADGCPAIGLVGSLLERGNLSNLTEQSYVAVYRSGLVYEQYRLIRERLEVAGVSYTIGGQVSLKETVHFAVFQSEASFLGAKDALSQLLKANPVYTGQLFMLGI